ncbi:site-specific integrase [Galbibacter sp. PAP.153]|uniref:site-specific integrase n=1 Tax=Galbibacter sp. PAP.153 TaxID=3104623 RepID=UPI00300A57A4
MKTFLSLTLDTRRCKMDGTFPIILRLTHHRRSTSIATGFSVKEMYWDSRKNEIKNKYEGTESVGRLNNILLKEKAKAADIINKLHDKGMLNYMSINQVKSRITRSDVYSSFFKFGEAKVRELNEMQRYGSAKAYGVLLSVLKNFTKGKDVKFHEVNYEFLIQFEKHHLSKEGNSINGVACYMRTLRAIYNKGIKEGLIEREAYPFYHYKIRMQPTQKRALPLESIRKIMQLKTKRGSAIFHYRNFFLISYMLYGMSFVDLAFLKKKNIVNGRVQFRRKKTSKIYDIKISGQLHEILKYYLEGKKKEDFIFHIIKRTDLKAQYKDIMWERHRYNKGLKTIAGKCNIEHRLTSYVARHSFATQAMLQNIPLEAISAMMGHSKLNTTQIYLKSLPTDILDQYHEKLEI